MITHITTQQEWHHAQQTGTYLPADFPTDSFIHCSDFSQVVDTANRYYPGAPNLIVLVIDPEKSGALLVYENLDGGTMLFPHLYGPLPVAAVVGIFTFVLDVDGKFALPDWVKA